MGMIKKKKKSFPHGTQDVRLKKKQATSAMSKSKITPKTAQVFIDPQNGNEVTN